MSILYRVMFKGLAGRTLSLNIEDAYFSDGHVWLLRFVIVDCKGNLVANSC